MNSRKGSNNGPRDISVTQRFVVALATPLILLVAVGAILALQISRMTESASLVDHTDAVLVQVQEIERRLTAEQSAVRGYQLNRDQSFLDDYHHADPLPVVKTLQQLVSDNPEQEARIDEFLHRHEAWQSMAHDLIAGKVSERSDDPGAVLARRRVGDAAHEVVAAMRDAENSLRAQRSADLERSTRLTRWVFVGLLLLTALALGVLSRRSLLELARIFDATLEREREARKRVELEEWMRGGVLAVAAAIRGELVPEELASKALAVLAPYLGAEVAALFACEAGGARRLALFGLEPASAGAAFFANGEGLVGRAALSTSPLHVRDTPADFIQVRSGLGQGAPLELLLGAARHEGDALAVIELGFFRRLGEEQINLLERVGETIAAGLRSARQRARLKELLEESQLQTEELQTQQEELRVANEELEEQSTALEEAQVQLRERQEELESTNADLEQQATDLEQSQVQLREKAAELERASQYKSEFLANMSHELRTPLNSSLILAKLLADNREGNLTAEQVKFATTIYSAGNDLLTLINDILDLSKIEAGHLDVHVTSTSIERLLEPVSNTFAPIVKERSLEFTLELDPALPKEIETDVQRVQQILKNLLSNAAKFTERGGIVLACKARGDQVELCVTDTGIGIPRNQQEIIFEAFRQADGTTNRKYGGTGLGLSISRDLARLLGGDLTVESEVGKGSSFSVLLPQQYAGPNSPPRATNGASAPSARAPRRDALKPVSERPLPVPSVVVPDDRATLDAKRRLLLVVEDDVRFAEILVDLAHELDFQCVVSTTAEDGFRQASELAPAAIILDVNLPDRSGLSVLDRLKRSSATRHIPVHVVSVSDYSSQALAMGAIGYMLKPVERNQLAAAVRKMEERLTRRLNRVLVIEDDSAQRDAICKLLSADDVETVAVSTVREAFAHLKTSTFDCAVTDLSLPDGSGFDLLEQMAADENSVFPPVIVYTGRSLSDEDEQRLRRYSSAIIVKGARSPERLLDEVTLFLHHVEADLPADRRRMLAQARDREKAFDGRTILVVEDDVRNVFALTSVLEPKGAKVLIARNGLQALDVLSRDPRVDLVLMDIMMPEMDGLTATREIRKHAEWKALPIIALTAKAMQDDQEKCLQAGANDYIAKPLDVDTLLSLLRVWMGQ